MLPYLKPVKQFLYWMSMLEDGTQYDILQGNLYGYKGAIFENLMADIFAKMGRSEQILTLPLYMAFLLREL